MSCNRKILSSMLFTALIAGSTSIICHAQTDGAIKMTAIPKKETKATAPGKIESLTFKTGARTRTIVYKPLGALADARESPRDMKEYVTLTTSGGPCSYKLINGAQTITGAAFSNSSGLGLLFPGPGTYKITIQAADQALSKDTPPCQGEAALVATVVAASN